MSDYVFTSWGVMPTEPFEEPANRPGLVGTGVGKIPRLMWQRIIATNRKQKDGRICALTIRRSSAGKLRVFMTVRHEERDDVVVTGRKLPLQRLIVTGITDIMFYEDPVYNEYVTMQTVDGKPVYSGRLHYYQVPGRK